MNDNVDNLNELRDGVLLKLTGGRSTARLRSLYVGDAIGPAGPGYGSGLTGDIAEILIYKPLSRGMQAQVIDYLQAKYGIATNTSLANGSFESPVVTGYRLTPDGGSWFFTNFTGIQANGSAWGAATAPNGTQTAVLQGAGNQLGSMSQMVNLAAGSYALSFKAARRSGQIQPLRVMVDSTQIGGLITPTSNSFENFTVNFNVNAGKHTIRFEVTDASGDKSTFIDDVSIAAVSGYGVGDAASFISQSVATTMTTGQTYPASVTMRNVGDNTWPAGGVWRLGSQNPQDNTTWGFSRV